jgi:hypothetical protein
LGIVEPWFTLAVMGVVVMVGVIGVRMVIVHDASLFR